MISLFTCFRLGIDLLTGRRHTRTEREGERERERGEGREAVGKL